MKKKPSINFGEGGIQGFLSRHVEKFVLGIAVLVVGLFVYFGWNIDSYEKSPDSLKQLAERAQQHINRDSWNNVKNERIPSTGLPEKVRESRMDTDPQPYWTPLPLKPPTKAQHTKRRDPELYTATKLEVMAVTAAVAMKPRRGLEDVLADEPNAEPPKESEQERKRREAREKREQDRKARQQGGFGAEGPPGMGGLFGGGAEGMMPEGMPEGVGGADAPPGMDGMGGIFGGEGTPGGAGAIRRYKGKVEGWRPGGVAGAAPGMGDAGMDPSGMPGMPGMDMGGTGMSGPGMTQPAGGGNVIPESHSFVAVKALVPYEKQFEEFERSLEGPFYDAGRDMPRYIYIWVERAEVTEDPDAPLAWTQLETWRAERIAEQYGGVVRETAELKYVDNKKICHPVPPVLMHPLDQLLVHSELPKRSTEAPKQQVSEEGDPLEEPGADLPSGDFPSGRRGGATRPGVGMNMPPGMNGGMVPPGMDGMDGMGGMEDGMTPPGMDPAEGGMAMPGYGSTPGAAFEVPKFKLVRFFDFSVKPGKSYKYRVKLFVEDPNNPNPDGRYVAPSKRMLAPEVVTRLDDPNRNKKEFWRTTEWSDPSEAVKVPTPGELLAGAVTPGKTGKLDDQVVQLEEDQAKLAPVVWDRKRAVDVPAERDVYRGTMLNFTQDAEVVHPISLIVKLLKDFEFKTDAMVVDLRGGDELPGDGDEKLTAPGEIAVIDGNGKLIVRNELDDWEDFRRFTLVDEKEQSQSTGGGSPFGGMPGADDGGGLFGPPGMGPAGMAPPGMGGMAPPQ